MLSDNILKHLLDMRGVDTPCSRCQGSGTRVYPNTSTWRGGFGGQMLTNDVCDFCWGSGDQYRKWTDLRLLTQECDALKQRVDDLIVTVKQRDAAVEYARKMFDKLPFDFGSNDFYESCDQLVSEVQRQSAVLSQYVTEINRLRDRTWGLAY